MNANTLLSNSPAAPTLRDSEVTRRRILECACHLFSIRGFDGTHIRDLCRMAGVNNAAVAYYFENKEKLYNTVVELAHQWLTVYDVKLSSGTPPQTRLRTMIESLCRKLSGEHSWVARILVLEIMDMNRTVVPPASSGLWKYMSELENVIQDLLGEETERIHVHSCAMNIVGQCVFSSMASETSSGKLPFLQPLMGEAERARQLADVLLKGLECHC